MLVPGALHAQCYSAALRSLHSWDQHQPLSIEALVRARPGAGSPTDRYWGGLVLFQDNDHYAELATQRRVAPFEFQPDSTIVSLDDGGTVRGPGVPWHWEKFRIESDPHPNGTQTIYRYYVNDALVGQVIRDLVGPIRAWVLAVSAEKDGEPDDGSTCEAEFGPVTVTGVVVS